jgi:hypothetical protein
MPEEELLEECPDRSKNVEEFLNYIRVLLKTEVSDRDQLPLIEIMTIIKTHKPTVFFNLQKMADHNMMLRILTEESMELKAAKERLNRLAYKYFFKITSCTFE